MTGSLCSSDCCASITTVSTALLDHHWVRNSVKMQWHNIQLLIKSTAPDVVLNVSFIIVAVPTELYRMSLTVQTKGCLYKGREEVTSVNPIANRHDYNMRVGEINVKHLILIPIWQFGQIYLHYVSHVLMFMAYFTFLTVYYTFKVPRSDFWIVPVSPSASN